MTRRRGGGSIQFASGVQGVETTAKEIAVALSVVGVERVTGEDSFVPRLDEELRRTGEADTA